MERVPQKPRDELVILVKAVISSNDEGRVSVDAFDRVFQRVTQEPFPWDDLGYGSALECLETMDDVCIEKLSVLTRVGIKEDLYVFLKDRRPAQPDKRLIQNVKLADSHVQADPLKLFSLSYNTSENSSFSTRDAIRDLLTPYNLREVTIIDKLCYIRFDDRPAAQRVIREVHELKNVRELGWYFRHDRSRQSRITRGRTVSRGAASEVAPPDYPPYEKPPLKTHLFNVDDAKPPKDFNKSRRDLDTKWETSFDSETQIGVNSSPRPRSSITVIEIHFLEILPRLIDSLVSDAKISEILFDAVRRALDYVLESPRVSALLRRVDYINSVDNRREKIFAYVRVAVPGSVDAFLERLWGVCRGNIPPLVVRMSGVFVHVGDRIDRIPNPKLFSLNKESIFRVEKTNKEMIWSVFRVEGLASGLEHESLVTILQLGGIERNDLAVRHLVQAADKDGTAFHLTVLSMPPGSQSCELGLLTTIHDGYLIKMVRSWRGPSEKEAMEEFERLRGNSPALDSKMETSYVSQSGAGLDTIERSTDASVTASSSGISVSPTGENRPQVSRLPMTSDTEDSIDSAMLSLSMSTPQQDQLEDEVFQMALSVSPVPVRREISSVNLSSTRESAMNLPLTMSQVFLDEITSAFGRDRYKNLPDLVDVVVFAVEDGRRFWGQLLDGDSLRKLRRIHSVLENAARFFELSLKPIPLNGKCMAKFEGKQWLRGYIFDTISDEENRPNLFEVFFVDFGFTRRLSVSEVSHFPSAAEPPLVDAPPPLALPFQLHGMHDCSRNRGKETLSALIGQSLVRARRHPAPLETPKKVHSKFAANPHVISLEIFNGEDQDDTVNIRMKSP